MNILITGGAGFIGHTTANALAGKGHFVRVLDNLLPQVHKDPQESIQRLDSHLEFKQGDVRSHSDVAKALKDVDAVYHFAVETGVEQSMYEIERYVDMNIRGTAVLCDCIAKQPQKIKKLLLASSRAVYGEGSYSCEKCGEVFPAQARSEKALKAGKWNFECQNCGGNLLPKKTAENAPLNPISIYGLTKRVQEELFSNFYQIYKIPTVILRYFNVIGAGQSLSNPYTGIASIFCSHLLANQEVEIYEDGAMLRDFADVRDVANANTKALALDIPEFVIMNIGSGKGLTVLELAQKLKTLIGTSSQIRISGKYRIGDIRHCAANMSRSAELIKYTPNFSLNDSLLNLTNWAQKKNWAKL